jgi:hypothetical protein
MEADIKLDARRQIVRCSFVGDLYAAEARQRSVAIEAAVQGMQNPARVRILIDGRQIGKMDAAARQIVMHDMQRDALYRQAIWSVPLYKRLFLNMLFRAFSTDKIRFFETEAAALEWLES